MKGGFTLIELLVTTGITIILTVSGVLALVGYQNRNDVTIAGKLVARIIQDANRRAVAADANRAWGVRLDSDGHRATLFRWVSACNITAPDSIAEPLVLLKSSVAFSWDHGGLPYDFCFQKFDGRFTTALSGPPNDFGTITVGLATSPSLRSIKIYQNGRVEY